MTDFTWKRGRSGATAGDSTDVVMNLGLAVYAPGTATTIRSFIVDWGLDLLDTTKDGTLNYLSPVTWGVTYTIGDTDTPPVPIAGPKSGAGNYWAWWSGAWFTNAYGFPAGDVAEGALTVSGRAHREAPISMADDVYTKWWLCLEIEDVDEAWDSFGAISWYQFLTAPTGT